MYDDFRIRDRWTGQEVHVQFQAVIIAIATRHADAVELEASLGRHQDSKRGVFLR